MISVNRGIVLHPGAAAVIREIMAASGVPSCTVTSTERTPYAQAQAMYDNCAAGRTVRYAAPGRAVQAVYERSSHLPRQIVIERMLEEIMRQGPSKVSNHCLPEGSPIWVVDIRPMPKMTGFIRAAKAHPRVVKCLNPLEPPVDPVIHLEIRKAA